MKHFYLIVNHEKRKAEQTADLISEYLTGQGCVCRRDDKPAEDTGAYRYTDKRRVPLDTECVIVLGGDGTIIQASRDLYGLNLPLFGVNTGHLGYLTQVSRDAEIIPALDELIGDHCFKESRMMLCGKVCLFGRPAFEDLALNEIVIRRMETSAMHFSVYVNDQLFNEYAADGLIVATPTGSTAYNLSAGGPIAQPDADLILLTPICPHTLNSRSIVLSASSKISVRIGGRGQGSVSVSFDGEPMAELRPGERVDMEQSKSRTTLLQLKQRPFLENIRNKMQQI